MKKKITLQVTALLLAVILCAAFTACNKKTGTKAQDQGATTGETTGSTGPGGIVDRSEFEDFDITTTDPAGNTDGELPGQTGPDGQTDGSGNAQTDNTKPSAPAGTTQGGQTTQQPDPTVPTGTLPEEPKGMTYEEYNALSGEEQEKFIDSFPSLKDFVDWLNKVKAESEAKEPTILDGNTIDLSKISP